MGERERVIVITGASQGIGRACAQHLHDQGWTVVGASRRVPTDVPWSNVAIDVDQDASVDAGIGQIVNEHGRIDAVLACAGWGLAGPVEDTPLPDARAQLDTNFFGVARLVHATLPIMRRQGGGRLILVSSIGGVVGIPFQAYYSASKFAVEGFGEALAYEVQPFNIHVTLLQPGNVKTAFTENRQETADPSSAYFDAHRKAIDVMARDEQSGVDPAKVARHVERLLTKRRPPRRSSVGAFDERIGLLGKRLLPHRLFELAARDSLGL